MSTLSITAPRPPRWAGLRSGLRAVKVAAAVAVASLVAVTVLTTPAGAATANPPVVPPTGTTYNDLAVLWWQYALGQPESSNPLVDTTGANCHAGQSGSVFFLAGIAGSGTVTRQCTVPGGTALFFPLFNAFDVHTPGDGLDSPEQVYADFQRFRFHATALNASVDGVPVPNLTPATTPYGACAAPVAGCTPSSFSLKFPGNNLFGIPAGTYQPAVQDGFYLLLDPLAPGRHIISFGSSGNFGGRTSQKVTYELTVGP